MEDRDEHKPQSTDDLKDTRTDEEKWRQMNPWTFLNPNPLGDEDD